MHRRKVMVNAMSERVQVNEFSVAKSLYDFVEREALPGTGVKSDRFWAGLASLLRDFTGRNRDLLAVRDKLQALIDDYHRTHRNSPWNQADYERFLRKIGYLLPEPAAFAIRTRNVDDEIAHIAGPQLVVPLSNARYALNAANARWGSLYDALYGTDAIPDSDGAIHSPKYNKFRGARVIAYGRKLLDTAAPLARGTHEDATRYAIENGLMDS